MSDQHAIHQWESSEWATREWDTREWVTHGWTATAISAMVRSALISFVILVILILKFMNSLGSRSQMLTTLFCWQHCSYSNRIRSLKTTWIEDSSQLDNFFNIVAVRVREEGWRGGAIAHSSKELDIYHHCENLLWESAPIDATSPRHPSEFNKNK